MSSESIQDNKLKLLGKLTASLIHEIRNPLSAIKINLDLIDYYNNELSEEVKESFSDCAKATSRIEELIENLLHYARKSNNVEELLSINEITSSAIKLLNIKATKIRIHIVSELQDSLPKIRVNDNKLLQVLLNLLSNAMEACTTNGKVIISTLLDRQNDVDVLIWKITDDGVGISEENQLIIFEDFFTSKKEGTGLGLSVCKMLLEEMGAELSVESEVNVGATFSIKFYPNRSSEY